MVSAMRLGGRKEAVFALKNQAVQDAKVALFAGLFCEQCHRKSSALFAAVADRRPQAGKAQSCTSCRACGAAYSSGELDADLKLGRAMNPDNFAIQTIAKYDRQTGAKGFFRFKNAASRLIFVPHWTLRNFRALAAGTPQRTCYYIHSNLCRRNGR